MELTQVYLKNQISRMVIDIYRQIKEESIVENIDSRKALQYLLYWNKVPDDLFEEIDNLLENNPTNMNIIEIYNRVLEITNIIIPDSEDKY